MHLVHTTPQLHGLGGTVPTASIAATRGRLEPGPAADGLTRMLLIELDFGTRPWGKA